MFSYSYVSSTGALSPEQNYDERKVPDVQPRAVCQASSYPRLFPAHS